MLRVFAVVTRLCSCWCASVNHSELSIIFATPAHISSLLKLAPKCPVLKVIVAMEPLSAQTKSVLTAWGESVNVQIKELSECTCKATNLAGVQSDVIP